MIFLEITQLCNICFTSLNDRHITEDIIEVITETLKKSGLVVLREPGIVGDYIRVYKEKKGGD